MGAQQIAAIDPRLYRLRHIAPATIGTTVLQQTLTGTELPMSLNPGSPDFVTGQWTGRLGDAGEFQLTFPNVAASDGQPWRTRFSATGHNQFIEIYNGDELEFAGVITKVDRTRPQIVVSGYDGWFLLKKAYESDLLLVMAPRDVIELATRVDTLTFGDDFTGNALSAAWTITNGSCSVSAGRAHLTSPSGQPATLRTAVALPAGSDWRVDFLYNPVGSALRPGARLYRSDGTTVAAALTMASNAPLPGGNGFELTGAGGVTATIPLPTSGTTPPWQMTIEHVAGRWVRGYVNGILVGYVPADTAAIAYLDIGYQGVAGPAESADFDFVYVRQLSPFLLRGTTKGDYVLPGTATTYPTGGLHGRYYNDLDLQADSNRLPKLLSPARTSYNDRLDATINVLANPQPGAAQSNWSARWFGAIYLKLSAGDYTIQINTTAQPNAVRAWIGKTQFGDQIIDQWATWTTSGFYNATVSAAALGGHDGWYPIIVEYAVDGTASTSPVLYITNSPTGYTDPGGTAIASGAQTTVVPTTSLSPLGCVDQRVQGMSHFDLAQQTTKDFGYQLTCQPMQLESGEFPGRMAPVLRQGRDTDLVLEPDDAPGRESIIQYQATDDAADMLTSMRGAGAGIPDGSAGQLSAEVLDLPSAQAALFDLQGWLDATDVAYGSLLEARVASELGLRLTPWENVAGQPTALDRLADTFPLTGALAKMGWKPGDAVRLRMLDVNIDDTSPRPMLQVTRQFTPLGRLAQQASFRARPKDGLVALRTLLRAALRPQRAYQRQYTDLKSNYVADASVASGAFGSYAILPLYPEDQIAKAVVRIPTNTAGGTLDLEINGTVISASRGGPWSGTPLQINITPFAAQASSTDNRLYARVRNNAAGAGTIELQILATVIR